MDNLIRDLSPITTTLNGVEHGRSTHPPGAAPPGVWVTEMNIDPAGAPAGMQPANRLHFQAKAALRTLVSFVNKGVSNVDLFAAKDGNFALVADSFFGSLASGYPGDTAGGEVMDSVRRLMAGFAGAVPLSQPRQLSLVEIDDYAGNKQFAGDGTADHPPLYNRDVLAFLPFQVSDKRFVIPVYVMTTNLAQAGHGRGEVPPHDRRRARQRGEGERHRPAHGSVGRGHAGLDGERPDRRRAAGDRLPAPAHDPGALRRYRRRTSSRLLTNHGSPTRGGRRCRPWLSRQVGSVRT